MRAVVIPAFGEPAVLEVRTLPTPHPGPHKIALAKQFGFDHVFVRDAFADTTRDLTQGFGVDIVVNPVGGAARLASLDVLAPLGRLVVMGNASAAPDVALSANQLWFTNTAALGFNLAAFSVAFPNRAGAALRRALEAVARGAVRVDVRAMLPLEHAAEAHRRIEGGTTTGKLVLKVQ